MKIGVVTDQLLIGGVQKAAIEQVRELNNLGYDSKLLIQMRKNYQTEFSYLLKGIPYEYLSDLYPPPFRKTFSFPLFNFLSTLHLLSPFLALKYLKTEDFDLLISWGSTTCLMAYSLFKVNKIPYIAVIHDPFVYILEKVYAKTPLSLLFFILKPLAEMLERLIVKNARKTVVISKVHFDYIKKRYGVEPAIIPLGVKIAKNISDKRGDSILSFGRWQEEKNPRFLLKLAKEFPKTKFIIAGTWLDKNEYGQFVSLIKKEKLREQIEVIPHYTDGDLDRLCRDSRVWVYPHFEAFGLACLEAAAHGLPVIIPKNSGVTESFQHGVNGFFPERVSVNEYKKYINLLVLDKGLAEKMGKEAYRAAREKFSWRARVNDLVKYVKS